MTILIISSIHALETLLSDKSINRDKIHLNENRQLINNSESKTADVLNGFFSNIIKSLKIPEYENLNSRFENNKDIKIQLVR